MALTRCAVCGERLAACDFDASLCRFHVGALGGEDGQPLRVWRCCGAEGANAPGCAAGCHMPAVERAPSGGGGAADRGRALHSRSASADRRADDEPGADDANADGAPQPPPFIHVVVGSADTLALLAVRHGTTPEVRASALGAACAGSARAHGLRRHAARRACLARALQDARVARLAAVARRRPARVGSALQFLSVHSTN